MHSLASRALSDYSEWRITDVLLSKLNQKNQLIQIGNLKKIKIENLMLFLILFPEFGNMVHNIWVKRSKWNINVISALFGEIQRFLGL